MEACHGDQWVWKALIVQTNVAPSVMARLENTSPGMGVGLDGPYVIREFFQNGAWNTAVTE